MMTKAPMPKTVIMTTFCWIGDPDFHEEGDGDEKDGEIGADVEGGFDDLEVEIGPALAWIPTSYELLLTGQTRMDLQLIAGTDQYPENGRQVVKKAI